MKKRLFICMALCMLAGSMAMNAQEKKNAPMKDKPSFEEMVQMKADRMAMEMGLDDKTADKFKKEYKDYMDEKAAIMKEDRCGRDCCKKGDGERKPAYMADADVDKHLKARFDRRQKMIDKNQRLLDLDKKYYDRFSKFLGPKQMVRIYDDKPGNKPGEGRRPDCRKGRGPERFHKK